MNLFYSPHIEGDIFELDEKESKHSVRVLRLGIGDRVNLVDGKGGWYEAVIEDDNPRRCRMKIKSYTPDHQPLSYELHLAVSPTKNMDRFEWFVEKATEIGITMITPLMCHRTERKQVKLERLERIIISAMKQSLKAFKPQLNQPVALGDFLARDPGFTKGIAHCHPSDRRGVAELKPSGNYTLLVGPEGDFTEEEVRMAMDAGYAPFHMGESRLRTETAGVYLCTAIQLLPQIF
ncbi:MAG: 16S rRNA (uracil(1498)-N(3))-methyltransferase [Bacteroidales bacterium]|nr:16S rRNA (uracil(1498)-N(3))-methyltransferase [Bacteroidales bacterium]